MKTRTKILVIVASLAGIGLGLSACSEATGDAPVSGNADKSPAKQFQMPDGFSNFAAKCDGTTRVYTIYHGAGSYGAITAVPNSPECTEMTIWFTSDPHWGHGFVAHIRGFHGDTQAHDLKLLENFQALTKPGDQIWWLGDLAMGNPDYALQMTQAIDGEHHLITGNHDPCNPMHRDSHKWQRRYLEVFKSVQPFARRRVPAVHEGYYDTLLSHYPYLGGDPAEADHSLEPRHTQYRLPDEGKWLLHGHTHHPDQRVHGHQIHVGLDAWNMRPVPLEMISELMHLKEHYVPDKVEP